MFTAVCSASTMPVKSAAVSATIERAHADDVDLARDQPEIGRRQREVARHLGGEEPEPAVPDHGLAQVAVIVSAQAISGHRRGSSAKLSTKAWNSAPPRLELLDGAT